MIDTKRKEELSLSYLNAICAYAGIAVEPQKHDDDSIDVIIKKRITRKDGRLYSAQLAVQLKSTSMDLIEDNNSIHYSLKVKNYNDLRMQSTMQQLLFLLVLPNDENNWIQHSIEQLIIRRCMYWLSFSDTEETENTDGITLLMPKLQVVSSDTLLALLQKVAEEEII